MAERWYLEHQKAMHAPVDSETWLVTQLAQLWIAVDRWGQDGVLDDGVADLIKGTRTLLNADHGSRLDMGTVDRQLSNWANRIGYCLDHEQFHQHETTG